MGHLVENILMKTNLPLCNFDWMIFFLLQIEWSSDHNMVWQNFLIPILVCRNFTCQKIGSLWITVKKQLLESEQEEERAFLTVCIFVKIVLHISFAIVCIKRSKSIELWTIFKPVRCIWVPESQVWILTTVPFAFSVSFQGTFACHPSLQLYFKISQITAIFR